MPDRIAREIAWLLREKYDGIMTPTAALDIRRLERGDHLNYVIGWSPFLGCRIDLSARPLIPRPETEYWTEKAIQAIRYRETRQPRILDIFCGSGCIGIAVLKHVPGARVDFADIEKSYFKGIRKSLRLNGIRAAQAGYFASDGFQEIGAAKYDFILANPPYIPSGRRVARSVLSQEPHRALFAGPDGLRFIRTLLREGKRYVQPEGIMFIEFDPRQKPAIGAYARRQGWSGSFSRDQYGRWRFAAFQKERRRNRTASGKKQKSRP